MFFDTSKISTTDRRIYSGSRENSEEANIVIQLCKEIDRIMCAESRKGTYFFKETKEDKLPSIGVITPYLGQKTILERKVAQGAEG